MRYLSEQELLPAMAKEAVRRDGGGAVLDNLHEERAVGLWPDSVRGEISTRYFGPVDVCP